MVGEEAELLHMDGIAEDTLCSNELRHMDGIAEDTLCSNGPVMENQWSTIGFAA